jgi:hypothetical protein
MSELFGDAVSKTCASDRDLAIFWLAYGASRLLFKLGDECELWDDDLYKRIVERLEKIKCMTSETYDEIARVTNAAWKEQVEEEDED